MTVRPEALTIRRGATWLGALALIGALALWLVGPIPQDLDYHAFEDDRTLLGIPNCLNVLSNLPFVIVGFVGALRLLRRPQQSAAVHSSSGTTFFEALPEIAFVAGVTLTAGGSAYYHLAPSNSTLFWDRLPMTFAFMGLTSAVIDAFLVPGSRRWTALPLLGLGVGSVAYWLASETAGRGDLRPYVFVQALPMMVAIIVLFSARPGDERRRSLGAAVLLYGVAKALEAADARVFAALGGSVSGHSLKHLAAAGASFAALGFWVGTPRTRHDGPTPSSPNSPGR
jgi:hypothetical protein